MAFDERSLYLFLLNLRSLYVFYCKGLTLFRPPLSVAIILNYCLQFFVRSRRDPRSGAAAKFILSLLYFGLAKLVLNINF